MATAQVIALPQFNVRTVHFNFQGGQAIRLRDHTTDLFLGSVPEWDALGRNEIVAYLRGTTPQLRVVFHGTPAGNGSYVIGAAGTHSDVAELQVNLVFDPVSGLSQPVTFSFAAPLPDVIGRHQMAFDWYAQSTLSTPGRQPAGSTTHIVCTTWRAMSPNSAQGLPAWVYARLVEWTSQWASGCGNEKAICDAIIKNLPASGLRYGIRGYDVREMLIRGGGMCSGWYKLFQQMTHSQGVFVHRRGFLVQWRSFPSGEEHWCALVVRSGGLNQPFPPVAPSQFSDHDTPFPAAPLALTPRNERRYQFWGKAGGWLDGHCVNFLEHEGQLYLYDACFATGPFPIQGPLPPDNLSVWGGAQLASFKTAYLDAAVDYLLGSLYNGAQLHRGIRATGENGITVRTSQIPMLVNGADGVTFGWAG